MHSNVDMCIDLFAATKKTSLFHVICKISISVVTLVRNTTQKYRSGIAFSRYSSQQNLGIGLCLLNSAGINGRHETYGGRQKSTIFKNQNDFLLNKPGFDLHLGIFWRAGLVKKLEKSIMRTNLLNWCHLVSISKNVVFQVGNICFLSPLVLSK